MFPCKGTSTVALGIVSKRSKAFTRFLLLETGRDGICFRMCWRKNEQETGRDGKMREIYRWRDGTNSRCIFFRRDGSVTIMCNDFFFSMTGRDGKYFLHDGTGRDGGCKLFRRDGTVKCNDFFFSMTGRDGTYNF